VSIDEQAAEIAEGLTAAQRRALLSLPKNGAYGYCHERSSFSVFPALRRRGLAVRGWSAFAHEKPWGLTPLGLAVRAHLKPEDFSR
jgi:hypothetical protein